MLLHAREALALLETPSWSIRQLNRFGRSPLVCVRGGWGKSDSGGADSLSGKALFSLCLPGGFLFLAAVVLVQTKALAPWLHTIVHIYPPAVAAAAVLLGWRFNRSRLIFAVLMLAIAESSIRYFATGSAAATDSGRFVFNCVAVLLPLNLAALSFLKERGITTAYGILRLGLIVAQPLGIAALRYYRCSSLLSGYLAYPVLRLPPHMQIRQVALTQPALIASALSLLLLGYGYIRQKGAIESGLFWALASSLLALSSRSGPALVIYFSTAGLILTVSVIEASYAMAFQDELTGLPARRSLNEFLLKMGSRYTVAMVDIDFFKKFNDTYGHDVGDQVLCMVASKLCTVSGGGRAFRYGGEEFTVIFPGKPLDEALPHLELLRNAIGSAGFIIRGPNRPRKKPEKPGSGKESQKKVSVTVSIGAAQRSEQSASSIDVVKAADKALYRAKKAGRNRVST